MTGRRVALVTGAARGLGAATARRLHHDGFVVVVGDIDQSGSKAMAAELVAAHAGSSLGLELDVTDDDSVGSAIALINEEFGRLDVLINNAGIISRCASETVETSRFLAEVDVHLGGAFRCSRAAFPLLRRSDDASIINLASVGSVLGLPMRIGYASAKSGILGLTRTLAAEWGGVGIRVNAVAPGYMDAPMLRSGLESGALDQQMLLGRTPLRRFGKASDVAAAISFLASRDASFITGALLPVDGGITIDGTFHRSDRGGTEQ